MHVDFQPYRIRTGMSSPSVRRIFRGGGWIITRDDSFRESTVLASAAFDSERLWYATGLVSGLGVRVRQYEDAPGRMMSKADSDIMGLLHRMDPMMPSPLHADVTGDGLLMHLREGDRLIPRDRPLSSVARAVALDYGASLLECMSRRALLRVPARSGFRTMSRKGLAMRFVLDYSDDCAPLDDLGLRDHVDAALRRFDLMRDAIPGSMIREAIGFLISLYSFPAP